MLPRFAVIDVGTNSVLLLVAEKREDGSFVAVEEDIALTRLGAGVDRTGRLEGAAMTATLDAAERFARKATELGAESIVATATSAARDAENGPAFLQAFAERTGVAAEILSGEEEARLAFASAWRDFGDGPLAVIDIGGGSTELIYGEGDRPEFWTSLQLGCVRLTERHLAGDPPAPAELAALRSELDGMWGELVRDWGWAPARAGDGVGGGAGFETVAEAGKGAGVRAGPEEGPAVGPGALGTRLVGIAGTVTSLCALAHGIEDCRQVHGATLRLNALRTLTERLASLPLAKRKKLPGLPEKRADVIVAGAVILSSAMERLGFDELTASDRGIRWGLLYERFG